MAEENQDVDIQALVDAAVKEAVAQSLAETVEPKSRQEVRNHAREERRMRFDKERQARIAAKEIKAPPERAERKDAIEEKKTEARKAMNQAFGQQEQGLVQPQPAKLETERKVTISETVGPLHTTPPRNGFNPREFLYAATSKASAVNHPWKVYRDGAIVKEGSPEVLAKYGLIGGTVYGQYGEAVPLITILDQPVIGAALPGFVYLKISRDAGSRVISGITVEHGETVPEDSYSDQYRPLAYVFGVGGGQPLQLQFEEIRIHELMLVENGAFSMHVFDTSSRKSYPLP